MALCTYTRKCLYFLWRVEHACGISEVFNLDDSDWCLEVHQGEEPVNLTVELLFLLRKISAPDRAHDFRVAVYFECNGKFERIGGKSVRFRKPVSEGGYCPLELLFKWEVDIWTYAMDNLTFVVVFDIGIQYLSQLQEENETDRQLNRTLLARDKGIQTPLYLEEEPCLISLSKDLKKLENQNSKPDLNIQCGSHNISAHRNILASRSEVFEAMLQAEMVESRTKSVEIVDMEFPVLQAFLGYLYTGSLPELTVELASRLYEVGDKYAVVALKKRCADFLKENVTHQNACGLLALADTHADEGFKESVMRYILYEHAIYEDEEWNRFCASNTVLANEVLNREVKEKYSK